MSAEEMESFPAFDGIPMTQRSAAVLARRHGFDSIDALANSLPEGASVLDAAAGGSTLGREVAQRRRDVRWINLDSQYADPAVLAAVSEGAPANLAHVAGDATKLDELFAPESFDTVLSYWLLPHLSLESPDPAIVAARGLFRVAKVGGQVAVGPKRQPLYGLDTQLQRSWRIVKTETMSEDDYAQRAAAQTRLPVFVRPIYRAIHQATLDTFGRGAYKIGATIYDPREGRYISQYRPRAMALMGAFTLRKILGAYLPRGARTD